MINPCARDEKIAEVGTLPGGVAFLYDDDDETGDDGDFDDDDEPSIRQHDCWFSRPGFGSPEWWTGG
jgi:hypothetical protein